MHSKIEAIIVFFRPTMHVYCFFKIMPRLSIVSAKQLALRQARSDRSELFRSVRKSLGVFATLHGVPAAMKLFGVSAFVARYWKQKIADPDFHSKPYGGFQYRGLKYAKDIDGLLQALLWRMVRFVLRIFHNWRWSWKKPAVQHL